MTIEKILRNFTAAAVILGASEASAQEVKAREATPEETATVLIVNDCFINDDDPYTAVSKENEEDWQHQKPLLNNSEITVLIQPDPNYPGYCNLGPDGFPQKYALPADERTLDGKLEKAEFIPNLSESDPARKFLFPCDLKAEVTPNTILVHVPGENVPVEVSAGTFSPGAGYIHTFIDPEENGNIAHLPGAELSFTFQPRGSDWYFGPFAAMYGNETSTSIPVNSAATEGPLAGQLVLRGENNYDTTIFGGALGFIVGRDLYHNRNGFGVGVELSSALMPELTLTEFTEKSAYFTNCKVVEGKEICDLVEGSDASNTGDDKNFNFYASNRIGLRLEGPYFFATPSFGFRTNFESRDNVVLGLSVGYNPEQE